MLFEEIIFDLHLTDSGISAKGQIGENRCDKEGSVWTWKIDWNLLGSFRKFPTCDNLRKGKKEGFVVIREIVDSILPSFHDAVSLEHTVQQVQLVGGGAAPRIYTDNIIQDSLFFRRRS